MLNWLKIICLLSFIILISCKPVKNEIQSVSISNKDINQDSISKDTVIIDSQYTFEEAIAGSKAPIEIIKQLELIDVQYYSTDEKLHKVQILTNKVLASDFKEIF